MLASSSVVYLSVPASIDDGEGAMTDELLRVVLKVTDGLHADDGWIKES